MVSVEDLGQEIADLAAHLDVAMHRLLECVRLFDESGEWYAQGALSCAHWLSWRIGLDLATARERVRVARALGKLPAIDQALRVGKLSYAKARALTRVATPQSEAKLLEVGLVATAAQLERLCRGYRRAMAPDQERSPEERSVRRRVLPGGMVRLEIVLSPDEADLVMRALDRAGEVDHAGAEADVSEETRNCDGGQARVGSLPAMAAVDHRDISAETLQASSRPDGMVALAENFLAGRAAGGSGGDRYQVMIHLDQDPLAPDGVWAATLEDGTNVSAENLRRVACDCGLVAAAGAGESLNIGRRSRSIPAAIRRALLVRDRGCRFPGCTNHRFLHAHHIEHWLNGGETSMENLCLLCTAHHRMVHEGGWTVTWAEDGTLAFAAPTGRALNVAEPRQWDQDVLTWLREWADEHAVNIGPDSNLPTWDGTRPDYDWAVSALVRAE